eukprot:474149_1
MLVYILCLLNITITIFLKLNTYEDNCICNKTTYNCYDCSQRFDLRKYLSINDNHIFSLTFVPIDYGKDKLFLPNEFIITLQRCQISFIHIDHSSNSDNPQITFQFKLTSNCYTRTAERFSLNITAPLVNISKQLIVNIMNNSTQLCQIDPETYILSNCSIVNQYTFNITHNTFGLENGIFFVIIESNLIDFQVLTLHNNSIQYFKSDHDKTTQYHKVKDFLYLLFLLVIPIIIIFIVILWYRKQYMNAYIVDRTLVLIICIAQFDDITKHLGGVRRNVNGL